MAASPTGNAAQQASFVSRLLKSLTDTKSKKVSAKEARFDILSYLCLF